MLYKKKLFCKILRISILAIIMKIPNKINYLVYQFSNHNKVIFDLNDLLNLKYTKA